MKKRKNIQKIKVEHGANCSECWKAYSVAWNGYAYQEITKEPLYKPQCEHDYSKGGMWTTSGIFMSKPKDKQKEGE